MFLQQTPFEDYALDYAVNPGALRRLVQSGGCIYVESLLFRCANH